MTQYRHQRAAVRATLWSDRGFTLIEMAVALVILGMIAIGMATLVPVMTDRIRLDASAIGLDGASEAIEGFAIEQHRLPCPDVDGDGLEGAGGVCGADDQVGTIPFRSLGLPGPVLDEARLPLRYGVYRNEAAAADLATLTNAYEPPIPAALTITPGQVTACGEILDDAIQIIYSNPAENLLRVTPTSGSFDVDDYVSGSTLDYDMKVAGTLPPPPFCPGTCVLVDPPPMTNPNPPPPMIDPPPFCRCDDFLVDEVVFLQGESPGEPPSGVIHTVTPTRLILPFPAIDAGDPADTFSGGDTIVGSESGVTARVTSFFSPGPARIRAVITAGEEFEVELTPDTPTFMTGQSLFNGNGDEATFVGLTQNSQATFQLGETISGQTSGASGRITADDGSTMTVTSVTGTFIGAPTPTVDPDDPDGSSGSGEVIVGGTSGADGNIISITENALAAPEVTTGSLEIPMPNRTESDQRNGLDMCKTLRHGILATGGSDDVHTVNTSSILVHPAFLLVSGGVEDAVPGDTAFDGLNEGLATLDFESPARGRDSVYDDLVHAAPMPGLDQRLSCARRLGAVNALALSARVAQNLAISAFNNHGNALCTIISTFASVELAEANVALEAVSLAIGVAECAKAVAEGFSTNTANAAAVAIACGAAILQTVNFAFAIDALNRATGAYNFACSDELTAATELSQATAAASVALQRAVEADQKGGIR